ncbi:type II toxin-antitoxin system VapC family toxin [Limnothrix redekei]|uniref:Type II toxin-antitoxin system VapC family toxin n=1 Tax=Limnothrix redekei LRLZ20PSL1 TaxID=3112953 RepID=A0ABW7C6C0_9CYAN
MLCDTNIISEFARPQPNPGVLQWIQSVDQITISVITLEEIYYGLSAKPNQKVQRFMERFFTESCTILPVTDAIAQIAGTLRGRLRLKGQTRTQSDILIAATAQVHQLILVTRNIRDFEDCNIVTFNPFSG